MINKFGAEFLLVFVLGFQILKESIWGLSISGSLANFLILILLLFIWSSAMSISKQILVFVPLFLFVMVSVFLNLDVVEVGGYNTVALLLSSLLVLSSNLRSLNFDLFQKYLNFLIIIFLAVIYVFYFLGEQQIPAHTSYILAGPYANQNSTAMILLGLLVMLFAVNFERSRAIDCLVAVLSFSIFLTQARAALLCLVIMLGFKYSRRLPYVMFLSALSFSFYFYFSDRAFDRIYNKLTESGSSYRLEFWAATISSAFENSLDFLFGFGVNRTVMKVEGASLSVHNSYVNFFASYGFLATVALSFVMLVMIRSSYKASLMLCLLVLMLFLYGFFETVLFAGYHTLWLVLIFLYAMRDRLKERVCIS